MKVASKELQKQAYPSFGLKFFFTSSCFKVARVVDIKLGFMNCFFFFYNLIILIKYCKTPYKKFRQNSIVFEKPVI